MGSEVVWNAEDRISELEDRTTDFTQSEQQRENRLEKWTETQGPVGQ